PINIPFYFLNKDRPMEKVTVIFHLLRHIPIALRLANGNSFLLPCSCLPNRNLKYVYAIHKMQLPVSSLLPPPGNFQKQDDCSIVLPSAHYKSKRNLLPKPKCPDKSVYLFSQ